MRCRLPVDLQQLSDDPYPQPHKDPLDFIEAGEVFRWSTRYTMEDCEAAVIPALRLALGLLVHPYASDKLTALLAGESQPHSLVTKAFRKVLADTQWVIKTHHVIHESTTIVSHKQVPMRELRNKGISKEEVTISLDHDFMNRLCAVKATSSFGEVQHDQYLFFAAVMLAQGLVPAVNTQVYYMLRKSTVSPLSYQFQKTFSLGYSQPESEDSDARAFEIHIMGGMLLSAWKHGEVQLGLTPLDAVGGSPVFSFREQQVRKDRINQIKDLNFDTLVIAVKFGNDLHYSEIDKAWVQEAIEAFVHDQVHKLHLPPPKSTKPLDKAAFVVSSRGLGCKEQPTVIDTLTFHATQVAASTVRTSPAQVDKDALSHCLFKTNPLSNAAAPTPIPASGLFKTVQTSPGFSDGVSRYSGVSPELPELSMEEIRTAHERQLQEIVDGARAVAAAVALAAPVPSTWTSRMLTAAVALNTVLVLLVLAVLFRTF